MTYDELEDDEAIASALLLGATFMEVETNAWVCLPFPDDWLAGNYPLVFLYKGNAARAYLKHRSNQKTLPP